MVVVRSVLFLLLVVLVLSERCHPAQKIKIILVLAVVVRRVLLLVPLLFSPLAALTTFGIVFALLLIIGAHDALLARNTRRGVKVRCGQNKTRMCQGGGAYAGLLWRHA